MVPRSLGEASSICTFACVNTLHSAMNTIVTSRAGKDLISSLCSGLLTIGSRFGGALDEAVYMFPNARDTGLTPREFVDDSRKQNKFISGIGHKIKLVNILNIDGCIAVCFVDLLRDSG